MLIICKGATVQVLVCQPCVESLMAVLRVGDGC